MIFTRHERIPDSLPTTFAYAVQNDERFLGDLCHDDAGFLLCPGDVGITDEELVDIVDFIAQHPDQVHRNMPKVIDTEG